MQTKLDYALQDIQQWRSAREYGFRKEVERGLKFNSFGSLVLPSPIERSDHYDCLSASYEAKRILSKYGINSKVEEGIDCMSMFNLHFWLRTESDMVVDFMPYVSFSWS